MKKIIDILQIIWLILVPVLIILGIIHVINDFNELGVLFNTATTGVELIKFLLRCCYEIFKDFIIAFFIRIIWICGEKFLDKL